VDGCCLNRTVMINHESISLQDDDLVSIIGLAALPRVISGALRGGEAAANNSFEGTLRWVHSRSRIRGDPRTLSAILLI
jgi:hypothetical protein